MTKLNLLANLIKSKIEWSIYGQNEIKLKTNEKRQNFNCVKLYIVFGFVIVDKNMMK